MEEQNQHTKNKRPVSLGKRILYYTIPVLLILFFAEAVLSIRFHYKYGNHKIAIVDFFSSVQKKIVSAKDQNDIDWQKYFQMQEQARPDSSKEMCRQVIEEMQKVNSYEYDPWVQFRLKPFNGKYVTVNNYIRKTIPDFIQKEKDTLCIWFFGGSTMFGYNVTDNETIPSCFSSLYNENNLLRHSLKVVNFGSLSYFSFQEYKLLQDRLLYEKTPDLVIFFDGLNEVINTRTTFSKEPYFTPYLREYFKQNHRFADGKNVSDSINAHYAFLQNFPDEAKADSLFNNYLFTINAVRQIEEFYQFKTLFVWQPVPYYHYTNRKNDPICDKNEYRVFEKLNPKIEQAMSKMENSLYLADLLTEEKGLPFIDKVHYSPAFNKKISSLLLQKIISQLIH